MSDNLARVMRPSWLGADAPVEPERRHIEIVTSREQRRGRPKVMYAVTAVAGIGAIVVAQLLLSVGISQGAYTISTLQSQKVELGRTAASINEDLVRLSSPQSLAANAAALGMVTNANPVYLRLSDGAVLGAPAAAQEDGATALVPNSLLAGASAHAGVAANGVAGAGTAKSSVTSPVAPAAAGAQGGLPSPTTR